MQFNLYRRVFLTGTLCVLFYTISFAQERDTTAMRELMDVEVVEKRRPSVMRESAPVQVMDRSRIERLGLQEVSEAVKRFSGVTVRDYGGIGGLKTVSVRSLGAHHTAVSYDGITITDAQSGEVDISRFSLDNVETVSLTMGQADEIFQTARMYASAGVLSIQTEIPDFTVRSFQLKGGVDAGSFGYFKPSLQYGQKINDTYSVTLYTDWTRADGNYPYHISYDNLDIDGKRNNSDIKSYRTELNLYSDWKQNGKLRLKGYWFDSDRGLPGNITYREDSSTERLESKNGFVQAVYENDFHEKLSFKGSAKADYNHIRFQDFHSAYIDGVKTDIYIQREYYGSIAFQYKPLQGLSFVLSQDFFRNELDVNRTNFAYPRRQTSLTALAGRYMNNRITITGSLLNTFIKEKSQQASLPETEHKKLSSAVSVSYRLLPQENIRVRISYKDAFRAPTFNDLYYNALGSRSLEPEKARQYNIGLTWSGELPSLRLNYMTFSIDGYYNQVKDKIIGFPSMFLWQVINGGKVNIKGADVNLASRWVLYEDTHYLRIEGNYSRQSAKNADKESKIYGHQIPYTPVHSGTSTVTWENPWLNITWLATYVSERYALQQNIDANRIKGYVEHQLSFSRDFAVKEIMLKLHAEILNLGNTSYDIIRYYPMPGRSFRAGIKVIY